MGINGVDCLGAPFAQAPARPPRACCGAESEATQLRSLCAAFVRALACAQVADLLAEKPSQPLSFRFFRCPPFPLPILPQPFSAIVPIRANGGAMAAARRVIDVCVQGEQGRAAGGGGPGGSRTHRSPHIRLSPRRHAGKSAHAAEQPRARPQPPPPPPPPMAPAGGHMAASQPPTILDDSDSGDEERHRVGRGGRRLVRSEIPTAPSRASQARSQSRS